MVDDNENGGTGLRSEQGKQMLAHAMSKDYCVLEFQEPEDGEMRVLDITDHVEQLEEWAEQEGLM